MPEFYILGSNANLYQNIESKIDIKSRIDFLRAFNGTNLDEKWKNSNFEIVRDDDLNKDLLLSDFPTLSSHIPVFSNKAKTLLDDLIIDAGEWIEVELEGNLYHILNILNLEDVLDVDKSDITYFKDGKRIMWVYKYVLKQDLPENSNIFKLPQVPLMDVIVSERFKEVVEANNLIGFSFKKITHD